MLVLYGLTRGPRGATKLISLQLIIRLVTRLPYVLARAELGARLQ